MKGKKAYALAIVIHNEMYKFPNRLNDTEKKKLYAQYFSLIKKSAYLGYPEALFDIGQQYEDFGYLGMPNPMYNPKKCVFWYTKACDKNHAEACNNLANFYEKGE